IHTSGESSLILRMKRFFSVFSISFYTFLLSDLLLQFTYLTTVKNRSNRKGFYCMSVNAVPLGPSDDPTPPSSKYTELMKQSQDSYNAKPAYRL
ncbi:hypothetical protein ANCCAN_17412, partial [Ancylostoma caninum]